MIVDGREKHEIWKSAYIAALSGLSAVQNAYANDIVDKAASIANKAVDEYVKQMAAKSY
ncbi:hypothetical protein [Pseudomonas sp. Sample_24]|uniref:hypothetical protein n=1 Tax=Pseudomonas sp. Sample_24 TaxID=2448268 RepID=UPI0015A780E7|nr:hypothetical protein [Pseudomonas sp. Sample_24]